MTHRPIWSAGMFYLALTILILMISFFFKYLFIWLRQVFVEVRGIFCCSARASLQLWRPGSRVHGLSCPVARGILVPQPGLEPVSPSLEGGFLTTEPPGKSWSLRYCKKIYMLLSLKNVGEFKWKSRFPASLRHFEYLEILIKYCNKAAKCWS